MTEYGDAALRREQAQESAWPDDVTMLLTQVNSKLDRILEILAPSAAQVLPPPDQEF